jgi:hypothetical protein
LPYAYSNAFNVDALRKYQGIYICFPSYAFSDQCADGVQNGEIKSCFSVCSKLFGNSVSKPLDFDFFSTNNAVIDLYLCTWLIRSEQAEEGAEASCFYGSCDWFLFESSLWQQVQLSGSMIPKVLASSLQMTAAKTCSRTFPQST